MYILEYIKNKRKHDKLRRPPPQQGIWNFIRRKIGTKKVKVIEGRTLSIFVNRYCNLQCFSCGVMGTNPPPQETSLEDIESFLTNIDGYKSGSTIMIIGGEPTMIEYTKLERICDLVHEHGYKTAMTTNGFKLIPPEWMDYIILDKHGINDDDIAKWELHLKEHNRDDYNVREKYYHKDIRYSLEDNTTLGPKCSGWIASITQAMDVVYPCCAMNSIPLWHGDDGEHLASLLREAGWNVHNPNLPDTIRNWRTTLPAEVFKVCTTMCWRDAKKTKWVRIDNEGTVD